MTAKLVGQGLDRVDARLKVTGKAPYAAEIAVANIAYGVIVTSAITKGKIATIDTTKAERAPGVLAVLDHRTAPKLPGATKKTDPVDRILQVLQDDVVHYADQPVALVVATSLEAARHGAALVVVRYGSPEKLVLRIEDAGENTITPKMMQGSADTSRGDFQAAFETAKYTVDASYETPVEHHNPMEPHSTTAVWQGDDAVTVYDATQGIFGVRKKIAAAFGIEPAKVRVISLYVGGGFGCKGTPWHHVVLATMAAKVLKRPVKITLERMQMFSLNGNRPRTIQHVSLGCDDAGKLVAIRHEVTSETSQIDEFVEPSALQTRMLYACPNVKTSHRLVRLDIPTPTFMRAPGESSGTFALESAMDELAYVAKIDPIELRLRSYAERDEGENKPFSSKSLRECYRQGAERFGWKKRSAAPRSMRNGHLLVGWGMATATYPANQREASATARLKADGSAVVQAGSQDIGTGTYTIMSQLSADALGLPMDRVRFELGDTNLPETPVSGGSQTASSVGSAVKKACEALVASMVEAVIKDAASPLHGLAADAITVADGALVAKTDANRKDGFSEIVKRSGKPELVATVKNGAKESRKEHSLHSFGAQLVEVQVDEALATVRVTRCVGAFAAGLILNAKTATSQLMGGIVWGIGLALHEHTVRDPQTGRVVTRDLSDYHVPVNADVPAIEIITVDEVDPHVNEIGAKGIGEIGITGAAAAVANAVFHATGRRVRRLPITVEKLL